MNENQNGSSLYSQWTIFKISCALHNNYVILGLW